MFVAPSTVQVPLIELSNQPTNLRSQAFNLTLIIMPSVSKSASILLRNSKMDDSDSLSAWTDEGKLKMVESKQKIECQQATGIRWPQIGRNGWRLYWRPKVHNGLYRLGRRTRIQKLQQLERSADGSTLRFISNTHNNGTCASATWGRGTMFSVRWKPNSYVL